MSILIPVYNGEKTIGALVERLRDEFEPRCSFEVVLVNDGSEDDSATVCRDLATRYASVRFVNLSRNFGEHCAVMAGLNHCTGRCAVIMDDDFQNPPGEAAKLVERIEQGWDVVFARYAVKQHHPIRNFASWCNNLVATFLLRKPYGLYLSSFKAINRFVIDEVTKYRGPFPYVDGLILRVTRRLDTLTLQHDARAVGRSNYDLTRLLRLHLNMFTSFSVMPLRVASLLGVVFAGVGMLLAVAFAYEKLTNPQLPVGWASTIVVVLIVAGVQLFALGLIGEYLGRLFMNASGQPQFVTRETINCDPAREREPRS